MATILAAGPSAESTSADPCLTMINCRLVHVNEFLMAR
jgi:hypothetical protein